MAKRRPKKQPIIRDIRSWLAAMKKHGFTGPPEVWPDDQDAATDSVDDYSQFVIGYRTPDGETYPLAADMMKWAADYLAHCIAREFFPG